MTEVFDVLHTVCCSRKRLVTNDPDRRYGIPKWTGRQIELCMKCWKKCAPHSHKMHVDFPRECLLESLRHVIRVIRGLLILWLHETDSTSSLCLKFRKRFELTVSSAGAWRVGSSVCGSKNGVSYFSCLGKARQTNRDTTALGLLGTTSRALPLPLGLESSRLFVTI